MFCLLQSSEMSKVFAECLNVALQRLVFILASLLEYFLNEGYGIITARVRRLYLEMMQAERGTLPVTIFFTLVPLSPLVKTSSYKSLESLET